MEGTGILYLPDGSQVKGQFSDSICIDGQLIPIPTGNPMPITNKPIK